MKSLFLPFTLASALALSACKNDENNATSNDQADADQPGRVGVRRLEDMTPEERERRARLRDRGSRHGEFSDAHKAIIQASADAPEALRRTISEMLREDFDGALQELATLNANADFEMIGEILYGHMLANFSATESLDHLKKLDQNLTLTTPLLYKFTNRLFEEDPAAAKAFILENTELNGIEESAKQIGLAIDDPDQAADTIAEIGKSELPPDLKASYITGLAQSLLRTDFTRAFETVGALEPSPATDLAVYSLTSAGGDEDPESTMPWATNIDDVGLQRSAILETAQKWAQTNPEGYQAWKEETGSTLAPDLLAELP